MENRNDIREEHKGYKVTNEKEVRWLCECNNESAYRRYGIEYIGTYKNELMKIFECSCEELCDIVELEFDMTILEFIEEYWNTVNKCFDI